MSSFQPIFVCVCESELTEFLAELTVSFGRENSVSSLFQNSTIETVCRPFPRLAAVIFGFGILCFLEPASQLIGGMFEYAVVAFTELGNL